MLQADPSEIRLSLERSLGATFKCPAGGIYQLTGNGEGRQSWISSGWQKPNLLDETAVPDEYRFPFLTWLRGMSLECSLTRTTLQSRLELDVARPTPNEPASSPVEIASIERGIVHGRRSRMTDRVTKDGTEPSLCGDRTRNGGRHGWEIGP